MKNHKVSVRALMTKQGTPLRIIRVSYKTDIVLCHSGRSIVLSADWIKENSRVTTPHCDVNRIKVVTCASNIHASPYDYRTKRIGGRSTMFGLPKEIAGTVIAAIIAAIISLLGLIISKENKVSEFRQAWIDSLRAEIAAVITHAHAICGAYLASFGDKATLWQHARLDFVALNEAWARIRLRLNPTESASKAILRALDEHEAVFPKDGTPEVTKLGAADHKLLEATNIVLKEEWVRVKWGESVYKLATLTAVLFLVGGVFILVKPSALARWNQSTYRVVERTDVYVDKEGHPVSDKAYDHEVVRFVLTHGDKRIYALCDLSTLDKMAPDAGCGLRPLRDYQCFLPTDDLTKATMPLSDITCTDSSGRRVYLYVNKEE